MKQSDKKKLQSLSLRFLCTHKRRPKIMHRVNYEWLIKKLEEAQREIEEYEQYVRDKNWDNMGGSI